MQATEKQSAVPSLTSQSHGAKNVERTPSTATSSALPRRFSRLDVDGMSARLKRRSHALSCAMVLRRLRRSRSARERTGMRTSSLEKRFGRPGPCALQRQAKSDTREGQRLCGGWKATKRKGRRVRRTRNFRETNALIALRRSESNLEGRLKERRVRSKKSLSERVRSIDQSQSSRTMMS